MAFSTNQVRQFYVAKALKNSVGECTTSGDIAVVSAEGGRAIYFVVKTDTDLVRSDIIPVDSVTYAQCTAAPLLARPLRTQVVAITEAVAGQDYILGVNVKQFASIGEEDTLYISAAYTAKAGDSTATIAQALADTLTMNASKLLAPVFTVQASGSSIGIEEVEQDWVPGIKASEPVVFETTLKRIIKDGSEVDAGTVTDVTATTDPVVGNGKAIADLEYFCMGERADIYRGMGWPNIVPTKYLVNPEAEYDVIDIHFAFQGSCEDIQKSEKDITIVVDHELATTSDIVPKIDAYIPIVTRGTLL